MSPRTYAELAALIVAAILGVLVWAKWPASPVPEHTAPAAQVQQADGSVIAARAPDTAPPPAPHQLPRGSVEERRERVVVAPSPAAAASACPPVRVDLSLVRQGSQRRMVASSPDGTVVSAVDIPIDPAPLPPAPRPWAAGLSYGSQREPGVWVERDVGRLRLGAEAIRRQNGGVEGRLRVGITW